MLRNFGIMLLQSSETLDARCSLSIVRSLFRGIKVLIYKSSAKAL